MIRGIAFMSWLLLAMVASSVGAAEPTFRASEAEVGGDGVRSHKVESSLQSGPTLIRVLLPEPLDAAKRYPVIYVLPAEANLEDRYGNGLREIVAGGLQKKHAAIFVEPTFAKLPWYADHPTDPALRQESYFIEQVVPFVDRNYSTVAEKSGRRLLGFSKSGWGAWSVLLRRPDLFGRAAAWDSPLAMEAPGKYGSGPIFGDAANFKRYYLADRLRQRAADLSNETRLILLGYDNFHDEIVKTHRLLDELKIPHVYDNQTKRPHHWNSGWVPQAVELLCQ